MTYSVLFLDPHTHCWFVLEMRWNRLTALTDSAENETFGSKLPEWDGDCLKKNIERVRTSARWAYVESETVLAQCQNPPVRISLHHRFSLSDCVETPSELQRKSEYLKTDPCFDTNRLRKFTKEQKTRPKKTLIKSLWKRLRVIRWVRINEAHSLRYSTSPLSSLLLWAVALILCCTSNAWSSSFFEVTARSPGAGFVSPAGPVRLCGSEPRDQFDQMNSCEVCLFVWLQTDLLICWLI